MRLVVNGEDREAPDGTTIASLLEDLGLAGRPVAVARNEMVVPRAAHAATVLADGDRIEILNFVGGGKGGASPQRDLFQAGAERLLVLETLVETMRAFQSATEVDEILAALLDGVGRVAAGRAHVLLAEEGRLVVVAPAAGPAIGIGDPASLAARVFREAAPAAGTPETERGLGLVAGPAAAWPIAGSRVHGVLLAETPARQPPEAPGLFAGAAGLALDSATLYRDLVESLHHIALLAEATRRMQEAEGEPESLVSRALAPVAARLSLPVLALYDEEGRRLGGLGGPAALPGRLAERLRGAEAPFIDEPPPPEWALGTSEVAAFPIRRPPVRATLVAAASARLSPARLDLFRALADRLGLALREARLVADLRAHSVAVEYLNRELARNVEDLRRAADLKSRFVSTVSHELRTPLASIRMHAETILDAVDDLSKAEVRDFVAVIAQEAERLSRLISDVLDLSRLLAGRRTFRRAPADLREIVERVAGTLAPIAERNGVSIEVAPAAGGDAVVLADRDAVIQALTNVLGNGVKYAGAGGRVVVTTRPSAGEVAVEVSDTGPGIPAEHLPHVFEEFYKVDATGSEEGTGLGLAITKAIVEGHGGRIDVESEVGRGSVFTLVFPRGSAGG